MVQFVLPGKPSGAQRLRRGRALASMGLPRRLCLASLRQQCAVRIPPSPACLPACLLTHPPYAPACPLPAASGLDVRYMKIVKDERGAAPSRWFRVVAMANSYQIRPH